MLQVAIVVWYELQVQVFSFAFYRSTRKSAQGAIKVFDLRFLAHHIARIYSRTRLTAEDEESEWTLGTTDTDRS